MLSYRRETPLGRRKGSKDKGKEVGKDGKGRGGDERKE